FFDAAASLDFSLRNDHLFNVSYERQPGVLFLNTIVSLAAGVYGHRFELGHSYTLRQKWVFSESYQFTRLTSDRRYGVPDNSFQEAHAALQYKLTKDFSLGATYAFTGFHKFSPLYYSPRTNQGVTGDFAFERSNKVVGLALSGSAGKLFLGPTE